MSEPQHQPSLWWMLWRQLRAFWRRPPARDRVLTALMIGHEDFFGKTPGHVVRELANLWGSPYPLLRRLESEGLVASEESPALTVISDATGRVYRRRVYWLTEAGRARALEVPSW
jgi:hypothetical protein